MNKVVVPLDGAAAVDVPRTSAEEARRLNSIIDLVYFLNLNELSIKIKMECVPQSRFSSRRPCQTWPFSDLADFKG